MCVCTVSTKNSKNCTIYGSPPLLHASMCSLQNKIFYNFLRTSLSLYNHLWYSLELILDQFLLPKAAHRLHLLLACLNFPSEKYDMIIFFLSISMIRRRSESTANTWHFSNCLGIKFHHLNLNSDLWCAIIFTVTSRMLPTVMQQWPTKKRQRLVNIIKCYIGKWAVQKIRY